MKNLFILLLLPLVLTACGGEAKVQTQDGFKTAQNWTEFRDNGVTFYVIGSSNYKVIDGHPIALGLNFATKGQNSMVYATLWNAGVTEPINCSFDGDKVTISVDNSSTTFSNCEYKSDDSRNEADIIISTDDREAKALYNKIIDADKFSITVTLQGGKEFTYKFQPEKKADKETTQSSSNNGETANWYSEQKGKWFKNPNGSPCILSDNYHIIDGRPIAASINVINAGAGHYLAAIILNDVSKNVEIEGERCPSIDAKYPRIAMMFDNEPVEWITERAVGSAVTLCNNADAEQLIDRLVKTHNFSATVRLQDGTQLQYKFSPYRQK